VVSPIADRYYGLRDFTIADPDGFGVRFASTLEKGATARSSGEPDPEGVRPIRILGISGSLRAASSNGNLIQALGALVPDGVEVSVYQGLGDLPAFNPDIEDAILPAVAALRACLAAADGVVISSPEYAHGVPGALKNALDWVVGSGELVDKPVALINTSPRSTYAYGSLRETLTVMSARVIVPLAGKSLDATGLASHPDIGPVLRSAMLELARAGAARRAGGVSGAES
jgi:NAD(P)H-dependent FMN reductase